MRTILFRAKRIDNNEFVVGDLHIVDCKYPHIHCNGISYRIKIDTICEFTGLKDKLNKNIFEGDILDFGVLTKRTTVVTFEKGCFMHSTNVLYIGCDSMEIVGNIHDNPELLQ